jgi:hypothetical protein
VTDYSKVLGNKPKPRRMQIYPTLDHFSQASQSGWMRPFDLAEYEAYRNAESEWPSRSFVPAGMRHTGMRGAPNGLLRQIEVAVANYPFAPLEELSIRPADDAHLVPAELWTNLPEPPKRLVTD